MIPQRNIYLITNELATESGRRIPEAIIERDRAKVTYFIVMPHSSAWRWPSWCSAGKTICEIPAC